MNKFVKHIGKTVAIRLANIDTDQIIPKQFLKRTERTGYGKYLFYNWRFRSDGSIDPGFILNDPAYSDASILIAGANFGCGSSREHAPWSLLDHGFRVVIAPGFADIFYNNSLKNGLLAVALPERVVNAMIERSLSPGGLSLTVDLIRQRVSGEGIEAAFEIDPFRRDLLLQGLDEIAMTLRSSADIEHFEKNIVPQYRFS